MYLSCLLVDVGTNPDRPRPGRLWLRNVYRVHQRLCMAFPSAERKSDDPQFLAPYRPEHFPLHRHLADRLKRGGMRFKALESKVSESPCIVEKERLESAVDGSVLANVHVPRNECCGFLFRIDPQHGGRVALLVQSAAEPDWDYAFGNARHFLAAAPEVERFDPVFAENEPLLFRLLANPTQRLRAQSLGGDGQPVGKKWVGKRVPVSRDKLVEWLTRRAEDHGFSVEMDAPRRQLTVVPGYVYMNKNGTSSGQRLFSACYEGVLTVTDSIRFHETLSRGIGPAKAFGFGLLSVAKVQP